MNLKFYRTPIISNEPLKHSSSRAGQCFSALIQLVRTNLELGAHQIKICAHRFICAYSAVRGFAEQQVPICSATILKLFSNDLKLFSNNPTIVAEQF